MSWLPDRTGPLPQVMDLEQAAAWQEAWARAVTERFAPLGTPLAGGALGIDGEAGPPDATAACAAALADVFGAEEGMLVRGAGTGAIRLALMAELPSRARVLVHEPATYLTTRMTLEAMGAELLSCDFNSLDAVEEALRAGAPDALLVQHMRPRLEDSYEVEALVALAGRVRGDMPIFVDDNYAPLKAPRLGCALGADVSAFSLFKHGGPEGVGCILGRAGLTEAVMPFMNSGGSIVQGPEAIEVVEALGRAALPTAMQSAATREIAERLAAGEVAGIRRAIAGHCPETVVLAELEQPIAAEVRAAAGRLGMATRPVGMESYHEVVPALLRPSKSLMADRPGIERFVLRVSAMRAGADLVIELLRAAIEAADAC